jgi:type IV pilus assembly protein PilQ
MTVTFSFNAVPYSEAFAYLLRMADLSYSVRKGMLVVGRPESLGRTLGTEVTKAYRLSYAVDIDSGEGGVAKVQDKFTGTLSALARLEGEKITLDERTRELYVTATEEQHREIKEIIEKLDHPGQQVMLEAQIFEVSDTGNQEFEGLITAIYDSWIASFSGEYGLSGGYNRARTGFAWDRLEVGNYAHWIDPAILDAVEGVTPYGTSKLLSAGLQTLENQGKGKTIANPSVITLDGQSATVALTENTPYPSGQDSSGNTIWTTLEVGPTLTFLPVVGRDGMVTINIDIKTGEAKAAINTGAGTSIPSTTRSVKTTVRVRDGEPFVVGGLSRDSKETTKARIPVLGYIPLLGDMFSYKTTRHDKSEVAMVVIPHILNVPDSDVPVSVLKRTSSLP